MTIDVTINDTAFRSTILLFQDDNGAVAAPDAILWEIANDPGVDYAIADWAGTDGKLYRMMFEGIGLTIVNGLPGQGTFERVLVLVGSALVGTAAFSEAQDFDKILGPTFPTFLRDEAWDFADHSLVNVLQGFDAADTIHFGDQDTVLGGADADVLVIGAVESNLGWPAFSGFISGTGMTGAADGDDDRLKILSQGAMLPGVDLTLTTIRDIQEIEFDAGQNLALMGRHFAAGAIDAEAVFIGTGLQMAITMDVVTRLDLSKMTFAAGNRVFVNGFGSAAQRITGNAMTRDNLLGGDGNDSLVGLGGDDTLSGGEGNDSLDGGQGGDILTGGVGDDTYVVDSAFDSVRESPGGGTNDRVKTSVDFVLDLQVEHAQVVGSLGRVLTGTTKANGLAGGAGKDTLIGGAGDDTLAGLGGIDDLRGGAGNDVYGWDAGDKVTEAAGAGIDTMIFAATGALAANVEHGAAFEGSAAIGITGNGLANGLTGNGGANRLAGLAGADTLEGGRGADTLTGGAGSDRFVFENGDGRDRIADFDAVGGDHDRIDLNAISAVTGWADLRANHLQVVGADVVIKISATQAITLAGVKLANLDAGDFLF